jgi:hypothetical protein
VVSAGSYLLSAAYLAAVALSLGFTAVRLRQRLLPWQGAPARLVEAVTAIALLIFLSEILGSINLFYAGTLVAASLLLAAIALWKIPASPVGGGGVGGSPPHGGCGGQGPNPGSASSLCPEQRAVQGDPPTPPTGPAGRSALSLVITIGVIAIVFAHWGLTTKQALDRGIFNFDSLWYHLPFAVDMVQSHSVTGMH